MRWSASLYPDGIHAAIAKAFDGDADIKVETATLDMPEHGLTRGAPRQDRRAAVVGPHGAWQGR